MSDSGGVETVMTTSGKFGTVPTNTGWKSRSGCFRVVGKHGHDGSKSVVVQSRGHHGPDVSGLRCTREPQ